MPRCSIKPLGLRAFAAPGGPMKTIRMTSQSPPSVTGRSDRPLTARRASSDLFQQPLVVPHDQVAVDLLHQVEGDADDDQQARAAVEAGDRGSRRPAPLEIRSGMMATTARNAAPT